MSNTNLNFFLVFWILFTVLNLYIYHVKPHEENKAISELVRQNEPLYINLLTKLKDEQCKETNDNEKNTFYVCADGTKVSMIKWTRGSDRKGVVTREYNPAGKLLLVYGHPDDVY
jgi:hypothetical protein